MLFSGARDLVDSRGTAEEHSPSPVWIVVDVAGTDGLRFNHCYLFAADCENRDGGEENGGDDGGEEMHDWE